MPYTLTAFSEGQMATSTLLKQRSLYPVKTDLKEVIAEAISALPITNSNDLIALLELNTNTVLQIVADKN
jgi:hypothetical protein